jgi:hypothetical protein
MKLALAISHMVLCLVLGLACQLIMPLAGACIGAYFGAFSAVEASDLLEFNTGPHGYGVLLVMIPGAGIGGLLGLILGLMFGCALTSVIFRLTGQDVPIDNDV